MKKNKRFFISICMAGAFLTASVLTGCGGETNVSETSETTEERNTSESEGMTEEFIVLEKINNACMAFFNENKDSRNFLSVYSILYLEDESQNTEVDVQMLKNEGFLDKDIDMDAMNLYIRPSDVDENYESDELTVFTACEALDGFLVYSEEFGRKLISADDFRNAMLKYNLIHGSISNPESSGETFKQIINAVAEHNGEKEEYAVRHAACDDLYAVVVLSDENDLADVKEYLLVKNNGKWNVALDKLEDEKNVKKIINQKYPDFEFGLLPIYNLNDYKGKIKTDFSDIINLLSQQNIIEETDMPVVYSCGTDVVLYIEFSSGKKLVGGAKQNGELDCNYVDGYNEAAAYLKRFGEPIPLFILKYDK